MISLFGEKQKHTKGLPFSLLLIPLLLLCLRKQKVRLVNLYRIFHHYVLGPNCKTILPNNIQPQGGPRLNFRTRLSLLRFYLYSDF